MSRDHSPYTFWYFLFDDFKWKLQFNSDIVLEAAALPQDSFLPILIPALLWQPAASILPQSRTKCLGSALLFPPQSCLCLNRHGSGQLDLPAPVVYDMIQYKTKRNRMFWLASLFYDYKFVDDANRAKMFSLCFCFFQASVFVCLASASGWLPRSRLAPFPAFTASPRPLRRKKCLDYITAV